MEWILPQCVVTRIAKPYWRLFSVLWMDLSCQNSGVHGDVTSITEEIKSLNARIHAFEEEQVMTSRRKKLEDVSSEIQDGSVIYCVQVCR